MKKQIYILALVLLTFTSCHKDAVDTVDSQQSSPLVFTASIGQGVTKTTIDDIDLSSKKVKVKWEVGDIITITDADNNTARYKADRADTVSTFTKVSGDDLTEESTYSAIYGSAPALTQTHSGKADNLYMEAPPTEGTSLTFDVKCGLMKLNLLADSKSVEKIEVTGKVDGEFCMYTLTCSPSVDITSETAFYMTLPAGEYYKISIYDGGETACVKNAINAINIGVNQVQPITFTSLSYNTPVYKEDDYSGVAIKIGNNWWAPINCGYDKNHTYGRLYQFGRKVGSTYSSGDTYNETQTQTAVDLGGVGAVYSYPNPEDGKYYFNPDSTTTTDWYTSSIANQLSEWPTRSGITGYVEGKVDNPCPAGWTVPAKTCMDSLVVSSIKYKSGKVFIVGGVSQKGYWSCTKKGNIPEFPLLFLSNAGFRDKIDNAVCSGRSIKARYWSMTANNTQAYDLDLDLQKKDEVKISSRARSSGYSVRCILSNVNAQAYDKDEENFDDKF